MPQQDAGNQSPNYSDFAVCSYCRTVNLSGNQKCTKCDSGNTLQSIESATKLGCGLHVARLILIAGVLLLFVFPLGTLAGLIIIGIGLNIYKRSKLNALEQRNRYQHEAIDLLKSLAETQSTQAEHFYEVGLAELDSGHFEAAIENLVSAIQLGRDDVKAKCALAASYHNCESYSSSIPLLEAALREDTPPTGSHELLAHAYVAGGVSTREQVEFLVNNKALFPPKLRDASILAAARFLEANKAIEPRFLPVLQEACDLEPQEQDHVTAVVRILTDQQDWTTGIAYASRLALKDLGSDGTALYARCLRELSDLSVGAVAVYQKHLDVHPEDTDIRKRLAQAQIRAQQFAAAIATYEDGLTHNGFDIELRYHLALTNLMADKVENAIAELQALLRTDGFDAYRSKDDIYRLLGRCLIRKGMLEAALKQYLKIERSPENLEGLYRLGELFESRGDGMSARACWEEIYATDVRFRDISAKIASVGS